MENIKRYGGILIKVGKEVLLCKRNLEGSLPGQWSIPAGKLGKRENPEAGALREFFEETNIDLLDEIKLVGFIKRLSRDGSGVKGLFYVFMAESEEKIYPDLKNAVDGDEHTECGYFNINNLPLKKDDQLYKLIKNILSKS
jgi:8-oxo-dGTP pyrophosphatase MutT (NUDIX family)